jgi:hypothetical protein
MKTVLWFVLQQAKVILLMNLEHQLMIHLLNCPEDKLLELFDDDKLSNNDSYH